MFNDLCVRCAYAHIASLNHMFHIMAITISHILTSRKYCTDKHSNSQLFVFYKSSTEICKYDPGPQYQLTSKALFTSVELTADGSSYPTLSNTLMFVL